MGGDTYVSGPSGADYMDMDIFAARGLSVEFTEFQPFAYEQGYAPFQPGLSALDYLFNVPEGEPFPSGSNTR